MQLYFPQGIATDETFCNRDIERKELKDSIHMHEHLVLVAPRRYGKTSLVMKVLQENNFSGVCIDFFFVLTQAEAIKAITDGISSIINQMLPNKKSSSLKIIETIAKVNPKLTFNLLGQQIEISTKHTTEKSISELLQALDQFACQAQKSCVIIFDEFQQIGELKENHAIEATIRHAVERSKNVSYIFCGSRGHLLKEMFSDKTRPLYHLCDLKNIGRIGTQSYNLFLNKMAKKRWDQGLSEEVVEEILHLTENHPYYVNALCRRLWRNHLPELAEVRNSWDDYVSEQGDWISNEMEQLSLNRRKVLTALAYQPTQFHQGQVFASQVGLTPSSINKCIIDLQKMDFVYQDNQAHFRVLDPAVAYFIRKHALK